MTGLVEVPAINPRRPRAGTSTNPNAALVKRLGDKFVFDPSGCWIWTGALNGPNGYGNLPRPGASQQAHRAMYELLVGPIPDGLQLDHLCRVKQCVNPNHLEPVTQRENVLRGVSPIAEKARRTHCVNGHEFTSENTIIRGVDGRNRGCRICTREITRHAQRRYRARKKQAALTGEALSPHKEKD